MRTGGVEPTQEAVEAFREELGLNDPLYVQYGRWLWNVCRLDLGKSFRTGQPVAEEILSRFPATLELASLPGRAWGSSPWIPSSTGTTR